MRALTLVGLTACTPLVSPPPTEDVRCRCDAITLPAEPVTDEAGLLALLRETQVAAYYELDGVTLQVTAIPDLAYFRSVIDSDTLDDAHPEARVYRVQVDPLVLTDPPSPEALAAVLAHELGHVLDYSTMTVREYLEFGVWYGTQDPLTSTGLSDYERATDAMALERGCADGLTEMRTWVYAHASPDVLAEKQHNYDSPEEIAAWVDANGRCGDAAP